MFMKCLLPVPLHPKSESLLIVVSFTLYILTQKKTKPNHYENYLHQLFRVDRFSFSLFNVACLVEEMSETTVESLSSFQSCF